MIKQFFFFFVTHPYLSLELWEMTGLLCLSFDFIFFTPSLPSPPRGRGLACLVYGYTAYLLRQTQSLPLGGGYERASPLFCREYPISY